MTQGSDPIFREGCLTFYIIMASATQSQKKKNKKSQSSDSEDVLRCLDPFCTCFPHSILSIFFEHLRQVNHGAVRFTTVVYLLIYCPFPSLECRWKPVHCRNFSDIDSAWHIQAPSEYVLGE